MEREKLIGVLLYSAYWLAMRAIACKRSMKLITKDLAMHEKYDRSKLRSDGKRAIVVIARTLLRRMRRSLLDRPAYALELAAEAQESEQKTGLGCSSISFI